MIMAIGSISDVITDIHTPQDGLPRAIVQRTRGRTHGPVTRLMSPSDLGEILKPFVFLDLFEHEGAPFDGACAPTRVSPP
jgi:hypothetical protein